MLDRLERILKTDLSYIARGGFWITLGTIAGTCMTIVLMYVFGNFVEKEVYGTYRYLLSVYGILTLGSFSGFNSAVARSVAKGNDGDFIRGFRIQFFGSLIATAVSCGIALYYFLNGNSLLAEGFLILGFGLPLMESLDLYTAFLTGRKDFRMVGIVLASTQIFSTIVIVGAIAFHMEVLGILLAYFLSWICIKLFFFLFIRKTYRLNAATDPLLPSIGLHLTLLDFLNDAASYLDRIALFHVMGAADVATYSFAIAPGEQLKGVFTNMKSLVLPKFSNRTEREIRHTLLRKMLTVGAVSGVAIVSYILLAPFLFKIFLPKYLSAVPYSQVYMLSLFAVAAIPPLVALEAIPKVRTLYLVNALMPTINIVLLVVLIPLYGLWGAVWARTLGRLTNLVLVYFLFMLSPEGK